MTQLTVFRALCAAAAVLALLSSGVSAQQAGSHDHSFKGAQRWSKVFDDPRRDEWQKPHEVIRALALKPDAVVADIGAGTGYFSARLAQSVPKGRVYAVDSEPDMVKYLDERAKREGFENIVAVKASRDDAKLPEKADVILLVDVYHHIANRETYFRKLRASLKPQGRLAIIDFRPDAPQGPPRHTRIAADRVKAEMKSAGYTMVQEHAFLPIQYFIVFR